MPKPSQNPGTCRRSKGGRAIAQTTAKPAGRSSSAVLQAAPTAKVPATSTSSGTAMPGSRRVEKPQSRTHSQASNAAATAISAVQASAPSQMQRMAAGTSSAAESARLRRSGQRETWEVAGSAGPGTVAPLPPAVVADRLGQVLGAVVGPEHVLEDELRIGRLPQQEIRQPLLARGTDDQVG